MHSTYILFFLEIFVLLFCRRGGKFLTVPFDKLDFGETSVLETFSNADVAIVDMTSKGQASLSYHVGVRHSLGMKDNFMLFRDENPEETISMRVCSSVQCSSG